MRDRTGENTQEGSGHWYQRGHADGYAGRPRNAGTSDWGHLDRYADGYEDGEFARYYTSREAETPLGLMRRDGRLRNDTARASFPPPPDSGKGDPG